MENNSRMETLLAEIAALFVSVTSDRLDDSIIEAQRLIVQASNLDRSTLIRLKGRRLAVIHSWQKQGVDSLPEFTTRDLPWMSRVVARGETVCFKRIDDLPDEAAREKEVARSLGIRSNITYPFSIGGKIIGAIAFDTVRGERDFPSTDRKYLRLFVDIIANALARTNAEDASRDAPDEMGHLRNHLWRENVFPRQAVNAGRGHGLIVGESAALRRVLKQIGQVAATDATVLLTGETGTGKELLARTVHELSPRSSRGMVCVNCAAIPDTLIESELFGHEKGAFTGATSRQLGCFELADGSTLFLDEVGELPFPLQAKLLRVLQEKIVHRLGSPKGTPVDVRIVAATNQNLEKAVNEKKFRADLYYRLSVFPIEVPPLRERPEDIPLLIESFVNEFSVLSDKRIESIDRNSMDLLQRYRWPGNIRELRNTVERAMILAEGSKLYLSIPGGLSNDMASSLLLKDVERRHLIGVLEMTGWRIRGEKGAAAILGLKPTTLDSMIERLGLIPRSKEEG